jgi:hypothetical protein
MTQAVFGAELTAPEVFGEVVLDVCFGILLGHLDGPTLLRVTRSRALMFRQGGCGTVRFHESEGRKSDRPKQDVLSLWI